MTSRPIRKTLQKGVVHFPDSVYHMQESQDLHPQLIKQARRSGQLNLSNRGLTSVPEKVWTIVDLTAEEEKELRKGVSLDSSDSSDNWWDHVDMEKLILACNTISSIPPDIARLAGLTILDLHDNHLTDLPAELAELTRLKKLNLSHNRLEEFPESIYSLKDLRNLQLNNNQIKSINDKISDLDMLTHLDLANNQLTSLPPSIGFLVFVINLNLSKNQLVSLPDEMTSMRGLKTLDCNNNQITHLPNSMQDLAQLEVLYLRFNKLSSLPMLRNCSSLKELHLGTNSLSGDLSGEEVMNRIAPNLKILDLRDNKLTSLPDEMAPSLQLLERLDLSNNSLSNLPATLGTLPHLQSLPLEGNPLKTVRRDIIARGTAGLLKYLRSRLEADQIEALRSSGNAGNISPVGRSQSCSPPIPDKFSMKSSQTLSLAKKGLAEIPVEALDNGAEVGVTAVDLSKNQLTSLQDSIQTILPKLHELNLSYNKLQALPNWINIGSKLQFIDFTSNQLTSLPDEIGELAHLREIYLSYNQFKEVPSAITKCITLETILIANNQLSSINVADLKKLPRLAVLDMQNNNIEHVPPELGNLTQIRALQLEGNLFRMPRPAILSQGTSAVMSYLRDRIPK